MNFWFSLHSDVKSPIGGVKQIHRFAECLIELGHNATLIQEDASFHPGWFVSDVPTISLQSFRNKLPLLDSPILVIPETFVHSVDSYFPGIKKIIFNQNSSYTFGLPSTNLLHKPEDIARLYRHPDILHIVCVSSYDFAFLTECLSLPASRLSRLFNSVDVVQDPSRIIKKPIACFMPRKNTAHARIVLSLLSSRSFKLPWRFKVISNIAHEEVISLLSQSLVFLSFGHPEGFGLPVAEALSCGCSIIGYSGLGGLELFENSANLPVSRLIQYGDYPGFLTAFKELDYLISTEPVRYSQLISKSSSVTQSLYSKSSMISSVIKFLDQVESCFL